MKEVQFHVRPRSVQVCFGYHMSELQNEFTEIFVCVSTVSVAVLRE